MSTAERATTKRLSSQGTGTGTNAANLEQQHEQAATSSAPLSTQQPTTTHLTSAASHREGEAQQEESSAIASNAGGISGSLQHQMDEPGADTDDPPRQVIAVSASKSPAAFFNLARKFLVTNDMCDLSALEGAIVSAVDAAHLLERSQLATIVRIHTSYVCVEPKRKKQSPHPGEHDSMQSSEEAMTSTSPITSASGPTGATGSESEGRTVSSSSAASSPSPTSAPPSSRRGSSGGRELRRARIVVTVQRTESYKRWLEENPLQAIIASEVDDDTEDAIGRQNVTESRD